MYYYCMPSIDCQKGDITVVKKEAWRIFLVLFGALVLLSGCILVYIVTESNYGNIIDIDIEDGECEKIEFNRFHILPGESCSYVLRLNMKAAGDYALNLDFERVSSHNLEKYLNVKILVGGRTLCDIPLFELFSEESRGIKYLMSSGLPESIKIIYYIPEEVGNEAQGAYTTFNLNITASLAEDK